MLCPFHNCVIIEIYSAQWKKSLWSLAVYGNFSLFKFINESLSLLLEDQRGENGSKEHSQGVLLLFVVEGCLYSWEKTSVFLKHQNLTKTVHI